MGIFHEITTGTRDRGNSISSGRVTWQPNNSDDVRYSMPEIMRHATDINDTK